uniref:Cadherin domain-containing protein n=1 Tax=Anabas testudineus TaxID=64144 RepID=A0A3Q1I9U3_ANATE
MISVSIMEQRRDERRIAKGSFVSCVIAVLLWRVASAQLRYSGNMCSINLKTVLENPLEIHYIGVEVVDINDHAPSFPDKEKTLDISESVLPGVRIPLPPARDPDSGSFSTQQYKLSPNEYFRLDVKDKGDDGKVPILVIQKSLDREAAGTHSLVLTAVDGGKPPKSGGVNIMVNVLDINDNAPVFSQDVYSVMLDENAPLGTTIIQVNASDLDEGPNGDVVYSFSSIVSRRLLNLFDINPLTGEIIVKGLIDYEQKDKYEIEIQASDKGIAPLSTQKSVHIKIVDVNDNAPEIDITSFLNSVPEDSRPGTTVALISVNDLDSGLNGKVICSIAEDVPFALSPSLQERMYSLLVKSPLDREKQSQYDLTIVAKDAGQPPLSSQKTIHVVVSDVNDNSPEFSMSPYSFYITEGNDPGASVFSVKAFDRDENENARISYHIFRNGSDDRKVTSFLNINSENGQISALKSFDFEDVYSVLLNENSPVGTTVLQVNATDLDDGQNGEVYYSFGNSVSNKLFTLFDINSSTGDIIVKGLIDYEQKDRYEIEIEASDKGLAPLTTEKSVIIKIVDVNDNAPEIEVTSFSSSIPEDSRPGTTVNNLNIQYGLTYSTGNSVHGAEHVCCFLVCVS